MNEATLFEWLGANVLTIALSMTRVATVFVVLPLFTRDGIPALVRNAMFLALTLIVVTVQPPPDLAGNGITDWLSLFGKEAFVGIAIGFFFGLFLWAFEAAGTFVDMQIGSSFAMQFDPIVGNEVTLMGQFLARWSSYLFIAVGGLTFVVGALLESFAIWPLDRPFGTWREAGVELFEAEVSSFVSLAMRVAAPIMVPLLVVDAGMGLVNRYAPQFNVFFLSSSIKAISGVVLLLVMLPYFGTLLIDELAQRPARVIDVLGGLLGR